MVCRRADLWRGRPGNTPRSFRQSRTVTAGLVVVAGGGIAGPAVSIALVRAGFEVVVYEAAAVPRDDAGAFLNLAPNGIAALRALGAERVLDGLGFQNDRLVFHNESGRVLADVAVGGLTVMRGALARALREAAVERGVRFEFSKRVDAVTQEAGRVTARCDDGSSVRARAVIGADGIHSRVRTSMLPETPLPTYTGIINLGGVVHTDLAPTGEAMHMVFGRRAFFGYAVRPGGDTYWFSNYAQPAEPAKGEYASVPGDALRERLLTLHRDDPPAVAAILERVRGAIGAFPIHDLPSLRRWRHGSVCLIGDAAHAIGPHVGQGASLALEDACVVAKCLRDERDPEAAFAHYESLRRPRVEPVVRQSRRTANQKVPTGWMGRRIRDAILPTFLRKGAEAAQRLYAFDFRWDA